ncbi:MAG: aminoacyl-tRNA hydrolase [Thermoanaerobaculia bacterium]
MVGLGNPGDRYSGTRHNVGFDVVDAFAARASAASGLGAVRLDRLDCRALTGRVRVDGTPVLLAKPQTYMNLSGESVKGLATKYDVPFSRMMIVSDDVAIPVGRIRVRPAGSSGGQKGLQNIIDCFRTDAFPRLRVGVGGDTFHPGDDKADYVLGRFAKAERPKIEEAIQDSCQALETWMKSGLDLAMTQFNRSSENALTN